MVLNKEVGKKIAAGQKVDRSKYGNKSCFRNETFNGMTIIIDGDWVLPESGKVEWDFLYFMERPNPNLTIT